MIGFANISRYMLIISPYVINTIDKDILGLRLIITIMVHRN